MTSPSVSFLIEPNGDIELIGSFDKFAASEYVNAGCFFPQKSLPNMNLQTLCHSLGSVLYEKGVMGHVTVDLISFPDPTSESAHPLFWAVDINCFMTDYAASVMTFDLLMDGRMDKYTGQYYIPEIKEEEKGVEHHPD